MLYSTRYDSPLGTISMAADGQRLVGIWIEGQKYFAATVRADIPQKDDLPLFVQAKEWLDAYFSGKKPAISLLPLAPSGSDFRKSVWDMLCEIPYGEVTTYGEIARKLTTRANKSMSAQAVGGAVGHNPISIIIPCHRVVGTNGSLTGYAGGIDKKIALLRLEGVDISGFSVPATGTAL